MSTLGFGLGGSLTALGMSPVTSPHMSWSGRATETLGIDPVPTVFMATPQYATDTIAVNILVEAYRAFYRTVTDNVGIQQQESVLRGIVLLERLGLGESGAANQRSSVSVADTIALAEALLAGRPVAAIETIGINAALVVQQAIAVIEGLGLLAAVTPTARYGRNLVETVSLTSSLANFFGITVIEALQVGATGTAQLQANALLTETVGTADVAGPQLLIRVTATETVGIDDLHGLQLLYNVELIEDIELSVGYLSPGDSFTTWSMNTRSGAVTEYSDYVFNSFARVGNKYLGASDTGLYELTGDTDAGDPIVSVLKGAYLQFGGTHLSRLKEAYIAATGDEDTFVLKIETLDGETYTYSVDTRDGRNTKVHMGKGQRARYFAYTLTSVGQDFTLDTLEFVPITVQRRV